MFAIPRPETPRSALYDAAMNKPKEAVYAAFSDVLNTHRQTIYQNYGSALDLVSATQQKYPTLQNEFHARQFDYDPNYFVSSPLLDEEGYPIFLEYISRPSGRAWKRVKDWLQTVTNVLDISASNIDYLHEKAEPWFNADTAPDLYREQQERLGVYQVTDRASPVFGEFGVYAKQDIQAYESLGLSSGIKLKASSDEARQAVYKMAEIPFEKFTTQIFKKRVSSSHLREFSLDMTTIMKMANTDNTKLPNGEPDFSKINAIPAPALSIDNDGNIYILKNFITTQYIPKGTQIIIPYDLGHI